MAQPPAGLEDLLDPGGGDGVDPHATLLRVLTDLYLQRATHTPEEEHYYTELALRLIEATDVAERAVLAARLAAYASAPAPVIGRLARDVVEVAAPILAHSPCLAPRRPPPPQRARPAARGRPEAPTRPPRAPADPGPVRPVNPRDAAKAEACELSDLFYAAGAPERRLILLSLDYATCFPWRP